MSATIEEQTNSEEAKEAPALASVSVDCLISGRTIQFPIHDDDGVLLLAEGSVINATFKELLRARDITTVDLHEEDLKTVTLNDMEEESNRLVSVDDELTEKLDQMIESGNLFVAKTGEAFADKMVLQGCKGYDEDTRQELIETHAKASESLDGFMRQALRGDSVDAEQLLGTAGSYLTAMMSDADCVLDTVLEVGRDVELSKHCLRLSLAAMTVGIEMGLDEEQLRTLGLAGLVHDWGMIKVPEETRNAPRVLSATEFVPIERHPTHSLEMLQAVHGLPREVPLVAYQVHERADGSGYPRGRKNTDIHLFAKILGVADAYLALTSPRPYRKALMPYAAMECIIKQASQGVFDKEVVKALLQALGLFPISSYIVLNDASVARVLRRSGKNFGKPTVQRISAADGAPIAEDSPDAIIDLADSDQFQVQQALPTPGKDEVGLSPDILTPIRPT